MIDKGNLSIITFLLLLLGRFIKSKYFVLYDLYLFGLIFLKIINYYYFFQNIHASNLINKVFLPKLVILLWVLKIVSKELFLNEENRLKILNLNYLNNLIFYL